MSYGGDDRGPCLNGIAWAFTAAATIVTTLRLVSRAKLTSNFGLDDAIIIFALLVNVTTAIAASSAVSAGLGKHLQDIPMDSVSAALHREVILSSLAVWTFSFPKFGIITLLHRLLKLPLLTNILFWFLSIGCLGCSFGLSVSWWVQCSPVRHQWDLKTPGTCWNPSIVEDLSYFSASYSAFLDILFAVFPPFVLARLNMPLYKRVVISFALSGGLLAGGVTIFKATIVGSIGREAKNDPTWASVPLFIWAMVECNTLVLVACLPTIGPFVRFVQDKLRKTISNESRSTSQRYRPETVWPGEKPGSGWKFWGSSKDGTTFLSSEQDNIHLVDVDTDKKEGRATKVNAQAATETPPRKHIRTTARNEILRTVDIETVPHTVAPNRPPPPHDPELGLPSSLS